jgi:2'-5' RNA ligase
MATTLAIVAYPILDEVGRLWVESTRERNDPQARLIRAHFTLVFPTEADLEPVRAHARSVASVSTPIPFVLHEARAVPDPSSAGGHVFLVPGDGQAELVDLHRRLYAGPLLPSLRRGLAYVPHVTVAAHPAFDRCRTIAQELTAARRTVRGRIESFDLVEVGIDSVPSVAVFRLGDGIRGDAAGG